MGRSPCCDKTKVKKGPWSNEEDALLINFVANYGNGGNWISLPKRAGLNRCGKSCRLRWLNYLRPDIKHGDFTEEEDYMIYTLHNIIGSRWSIIASKLPGRTDNDVKNYWNTKLKRKISSGKFNIIDANKNYDAGISSNINNTDYSTLYWPTLGNNENLIMNSELNVSLKDHHHQIMQLEQQSGHNDNFIVMGESDEEIREKCYTTSSSVTQESSSSSSSSSSVDFIQSNGIDLIAVRGEEDEFWMDLLSDSFDDGVVVGSILDEKILEMASLLDDSFNC